MEAFVFPFPLLEDSLVLGAINGNGKTKKLCFYHNKLRILLHPRAINKRIDEEEEEMEERERVMWFGQEGYRGVVLCEFEEELRALYREGRGFGWEIIFEF